MLCYRVADATSRGELHIPNAPNLSGGAALTLCGYVDVTYEEVEGEPDCEECLSIVRYCKGLRLGKIRK